MDDRIRHMPEVKLWFVLLGRGVLGVVVGIPLLSNPWASIRQIASLFIGYLIADCVLSFFAASYAARAGKRRRELAVVGIVDALAAVAAFTFPTALPLRLISGVRGVIGGAADAHWSRRLALSDLLALGGVAAVGIGLLLLAWPGPGVTALPWLLALQAMVSGALLFAGAMSEIRRVDETILPHAT